MEKLEEIARKSMKSTRLQIAILRTAESLKLLTTAGLSGSVYKMYKILDREERRRKYRSILAARERLIENKCLKWEGKHIVLTEIGRKILQSWENRSYKIPRPAKWDGKWRMLIFDIPETRKALREKVRNTLRAIGFKWLQDSVWVYPFDCEDFVTLLKADFKIGKDVLYVIAEAIENDRKIRDHFGVYS